jgi:hypothetical protein
MARYFIQKLFIEYMLPEPRHLHIAALHNQGPPRKIGEDDHRSGKHLRGSHPEDIFAEFKTPISTHA